MDLIKEEGETITMAVGDCDSSDATKVEESETNVKDVKGVRVWGLFFWFFFHKLKFRVNDSGICGIQSQYSFGVGALMGSQDGE